MEDKEGEHESETSAASKVTFKSFAKLLEQLSKIDSSTNSRSLGKNEEKKRILQKFYQAYRSLFTSNQKADLFPIIRLLLPSDDRRTYGLKETRLAKYLIDALCIAPRSDDALKLVNYRAPSSVNKSESGDFASVAYFVLKNRTQENCTLSVEEVNHYLNTIAENNAKGKEGQKEVNNSIKHLLVNLSAVQLKWLIRIILKDLKIGIKENTILDAFHPDAVDLYNFTSSLEKVCATLLDAEKRLHEIGVSVFEPCRPMLGEKAKPSQVEKLMNGEKFHIETKFDGERFQLHKRGAEYKYFSRNAHDYTDEYGASFNTGGSLTPFIHSCFNPEANTVILDGEMCFYNAKEKMLLSLPEEHDVRSSKNYDDIQTCFCVFDILLYNENVLTNRPLRERIEFMRRAFCELEGRIIYSPVKVASSNQEVVDALNEAIDLRREGIVVKNPESVYKPSVRGGSGWFKVKPDYMLGLNDDLDLLIVGGYYGSGRRSGLLSHFLLAVAVDENGAKEEDRVEMIGEPKLFYSFTKVGSGFSHKELLDFNLKLKEKWQVFDKKNPPKHLGLSYEKPEVWIEPKDSLIVQIKAVEIVPSDRYKTGVSLRFPRLEKFREDKPWYECMRLSELNELREKNDGKLASGKHFDLNDYDDDGNLLSDEPVKKKTRKGAGKKGGVDVRFKGVDASTVEKVGDLFEGKEFCVIMGNEKWDKANLEKKIVELGGEIVQNPGENTFCVVTSKTIHKVAAYIKKDLYDVVKADWLISCIEEGKFLKWSPNDMIHSKLETRNYFSKYFDAYGDSFAEECTVHGLRQLFNSMKENEMSDAEFEESRMRERIAEIEMKYFGDEFYDLGVFRLCVFYVDIYEELNAVSLKRVKDSSLDLIELKLKWHGGIVRNEIDESVTHCVLDSRDLSRLDEIKKVNRKRMKKMHVVSSEWVNLCVNAGRTVDELPYHL